MNKPKLPTEYLLQLSSAVVKKIGYKIARIYECLLLQCTLVAPNKGHEIYCNARDLISSLNNESCSFGTNGLKCQRLVSLLTILNLNKK